MFRVEPRVVAARPAAFAALYRSADIVGKVLGVRRRPAPRRQESMADLEHRSERLLTDCLVATNLEVRQYWEMSRNVITC